MVKAQTSREQADIAKASGMSLFCYACKTSGTINVDGPIHPAVAAQLNRLMVMVIVDRVPVDKLESFLDSLE